MACAKTSACGDDIEVLPMTCATNLAGAGVLEPDSRRCAEDLARDQAVVDGDLDLARRAGAAVTAHRPRHCTPRVAIPAAVSVASRSYRLYHSANHTAGIKSGSRDREPAIEVSP